jgi:Zn-dependent M16 (insulinase) family peptidase
VYSSPDAYKAFAASKKVVEDYISGAEEFDPLAVEGAISSLVYMLASQQATMAEAAQDKFILQVLKDLPRDWNDILLEKIRNVSTSQIKDAMRDLLLPIFEPAKANLFVTCAPVMEKVRTRLPPVLAA